MDGQQPNFELPPVNIAAHGEQHDFKQTLSPESGREALLPQPEKIANPPAAPAPVALPQSVQMASLAAAPAAVQQTPQPADDGSSSLPALADDADLIEKEWVNKAKQIVDKTKTNPYLQNREISKFKAGYIKKRYNKDIRVSED